MGPHSIAVISESECIGCTKCIKVCPVDAIVGSAKKMHTVLSEDCTGCEACLSACPVNCIQLHPIENTANIDWDLRAHRADINTQRRNQRLEAVALTKMKERNSSKATVSHIKLEIEACVLRKKAQRLHQNQKQNEPQKT